MELTWCGSNVAYMLLFNNQPQDEKSVSNVAQYRQPELQMDHGEQSQTRWNSQDCINYAFGVD